LNRSTRSKSASAEIASSARSIIYGLIQRLQQCISSDVAIVRTQLEFKTSAKLPHSPKRGNVPMSFSMSKASIPIFEIGLTALSAVLDKAAAYAVDKKIEPSVLLQWRLSPDMFSLVRQVQIASDQAKNGSSRLAGVEAPRYEDNETTIDQLKERIAKTVAYVKGLDAAKIDGSADREITFPLGPTNKGHMKGADYLNHFVLPNFYFHTTAAYAIVRHCGVDIGKRDFMGAIPMKMT
jgi:uncharacterized protein